MATYNKRGYKPKTKEEVIQQVEEDSTTAEVFNTLDDSASKVEEFVERNQKYIFILIGIVALFVLGTLAYKNFILKPKQKEAASAIYKAQTYFDDALNQSKDSLYVLALNGDGDAMGMLDIIKEYKGTASANLANYYAGTAYLKLNKYKEAIEHLDAFDSDDEILAPLAKGNIGNAFAELDQKEDALSYYEEAAQMRDNSYTTPMFLYKAGVTALGLDNNTKALQCFERIDKDYPKSEQANQVKVLIAKLKAMQ